MKVKCSHCNGMVEITFDRLILENEDEEAFVTFLSCEMSRKEDCTPENRK